MKRRSFIWRSLAALTALPLVDKLVPAAEKLHTISAPVEWHPSMIPGCLSWDGVNYGPDGSPVGEMVMPEHMHGGGMFGRVLTEEEKRQIYDYMNRKYGFTL